MKRRAKPPPKPERLQVLVRLSEPLVDALDRWCAEQLDRPTRAEALRRFAVKVLKEEGKP